MKISTLLACRRQALAIGDRGLVLEIDADLARLGYSAEVEERPVKRGPGRPRKAT